MSSSKLRPLQLVSVHPHGDLVEAVVTIPISVFRGTNWSAVVLNLPTLPLSFHVTESHSGCFASKVLGVDKTWPTSDCIYSSPSWALSLLGFLT